MVWVESLELSQGSRVEQANNSARLVRAVGVEGRPRLGRWHRGRGRIWLAVAADRSRAVAPGYVTGPRMLLSWSMERKLKEEIILLMLNSPNPHLSLSWCPALASKGLERIPDF